MRSHNNATRAFNTWIVAAMVSSMLAACATRPHAVPDTLTISMLGTNDVHGELLPKPDRGGLVAISAYVDALRAARDEDNGAVLVIDAGDMWQGTLESNLVEGAAVVEAYNAIGFDAATIGNHEFDFGPVGSKAIPQQSDDDPRGALKRRVSEANFPVLAANLIDEKTGRPIEWGNVRPSTMLDVQGIKVGIVGVLSEHALRATISANTGGLRVAPLVETIRKEATTLRSRGAAVVIVTAHAGAYCTEFDNPSDLSSCNMGGEIMRVAEALPAGLVDHIFAGHVHQGIAHIVNGISITSAYSNTLAFSRVDFEVDRHTGKIVARQVFAPHHTCLSVVRYSGECASPSDKAGEIMDARYAGRAIVPNAAITEIAARAATFAEGIKAEKLGVYLESPFEHPPSAESALANLMTDALLESLDADISIHNVIGGIRNGLPQGDLTFGAVYEMFPFDNRIVVLDLSGRQVRRIIAKQAHKHRRRAGISGLRVFVSCSNDKMNVVMTLADGADVEDDDRIRVIANDFLAFGGDDVLTPVLPEGGFDVDDSMPLTRDVLVEWFRSRAGSLNPEDFLTTASPKWNVPDSLPASCTL